MILRSAAAMALAAGLAACAATTSEATPTPAPTTAPAEATPSAATSASPAPAETAASSPSPDQPAVGGVYAGTVSGELDPRVADVPERVYVPNEESDDVAVIDPATFEVIDRFPAGDAPEHVNPGWDLQELYVANMNGGTLTVVDPMTSQPTGEIDLDIFPYALYYTLDGEKVMVVTDYISWDDIEDNGVHFYDRETWEYLSFVKVPWPGADDADLTADGRHLVISAEYAGWVVFIDTEAMEMTDAVEVGSLPRDVRLSPDGRTIYVANEGLGGVQTIDVESRKLTGFIETGAGTHGLDFSRDTSLMYVANRAAGTITLVDTATNEVVEDWAVGGSPDELVLNPDGSQLWVSNRYHGSVSVVDTATGQVIATIPTGANPHGLTYWPQPGGMAIGQNGNMR